MEVTEIRSAPGAKPSGAAVEKNALMADNAYRPAVMADVARLAGVSHQTVSRVLNDHPRVAPTTRTRVLAAIEELGYRRNTAARALVTRRSERLGVVSFDTTLYGPASTLLSVEQAAREAGYFVSIVSLKQIDVHSIGEALGHLLDQSVDGIMVIAPQHESVEALTRFSAPVPVVAVEGGPPDLPNVAVDQHGGAVLATDHLLELGHDHGLARRRAQGLAGDRGADRRLARRARTRRRHRAAAADR